MAQTSRPGRKKSEDWIQSVSDQSWEPELLISGLLIYATFLLPDLFFEGLEYYRYHLQTGTGTFDRMIPVLIYGILATIAYLLNIAFIIHFVTRAFWVGFIGLKSVYRKGINYHKLPYSQLYREQSRKRLGSSDEMIRKLDRISSLIFSGAFAFVFIFVGTGFFYIVIFLIYNLFKLFLPPEVFDTWSSILLWTLSLVGISYVMAIVILNLKRFRSNPRLARWHFILTWKSSTIMMPLIYRPVQFINLTFQSNVSTRRYATTVVILFLFFMAVLNSVVLTAAQGYLIQPRDYFGTPHHAYSYSASQYDRFLSEDDLVQTPTLEQPVVSGSLLALFLPYPKVLDEKLNQYCSPEELPDTLSGFRRSEVQNEQSISCVERFFTVTLDDTVTLEPDLLFTRHRVTGQDGFRSFISLPDLEPGKHVLKVKRPVLDERDRERRDAGRPLTFEAQIPFWIE